MDVRVIYQKEEKVVKLPEPSTIADALKTACVPVQAVIPRRNGVVVTDADEVNDGDEIDALRIVSGG